MNCKQAKTELALWVGGDLDEESSLRVERHVTVCPECRLQRDEMVVSLQALRKSGELVSLSLSQVPTSEKGARPPRGGGMEGMNRPPRPAADDSLWPGIAARIESTGRNLRSPRFNGWAPLVAVMAACVVVTVLSSRNNISERGSMPAMPVFQPSFGESAFPDVQFVPVDQRIPEEPRMERRDLEVPLEKLIPFDDATRSRQSITPDRRERMPFPRIDDAFRLRWAR